MMTFDFQLSASANGTLVVNMTPPVSISGWTIQYAQSNRPGGSGFVQKWMASGFAAGQSGANIINGLEGIFSVSFNPAEMSGFDPKNYYFNIYRQDSGSVIPLVEGFRLCNP